MNKHLRDIREANIKNKTVIVRANLDVPIKNGMIEDDTRIRASVATIEYLLSQNCKIVILAHLGRPEGEYKDEFSLMPVRFALGDLLSKQVKFVDIKSSDNSIKFMENKDILLLENLRFHKEEESKNKNERLEFVKKLSELCDIYVNDCFGLYRKHASVWELPSIMDSYAGLQMQKEVEALSKIKTNAEKPFIVVLGGAKIDSKIQALKSFVKKADSILIGGAAAYTFLKASGVKVGKSFVEESMLSEAKEILNLSKKHSCEIILPIDHLCGEKFSSSTKQKLVNSPEIPKNLIGLDIGPKTVNLYKAKLDYAQSVLWNGPMGVFEWENFSSGTKEIGDHISLSLSKNVYKIAGGGDTTLAIKFLKIKSKSFNHISVGGGMMLEYIANDRFEIIDILRAK